MPITHKREPFRVWRQLVEKTQTQGQPVCWPSPKEPEVGCAQGELEERPSARFRIWAADYGTSADQDWQVQASQLGLRPQAVSEAPTLRGQTFL